MSVITLKKLICLFCFAIVGNIHSGNERKASIERRTDLSYPRFLLTTSLSTIGELYTHIENCPFTHRAEQEAIELISEWQEQCFKAPGRSKEDFIRQVVQLHDRANHYSHDRFWGLLRAGVELFLAHHYDTFFQVNECGTSVVCDPIYYSLDNVDVEAYARIHTLAKGWK